jgi:phosphoribosyl 1,2-cyclic phosphodiesterase
VSIRVTFWGVRGSVPCPGPKTVKYGGNTSCLELRFGDEDRLVVIDAGTGIRELAGHVMKTDLPKGPIKTELFLTHTHWDHIMGFPFFIPLFIPTTELTVYGPVTFEDDPLEKIFGDMLQYRYWPVRQEELAAKIKYEELKERSMDLGEGLWVTTKYLNHPVLVLGYRFEYRGKVFCTAYDTEPFRNLFDVSPDDPSYDAEAVKEGALAAAEENDKVTEFFRGADILIHDTQYTYNEYVNPKSPKLNWGHSSFEHAVNVAHKAGVKKLLLFHHDPDRSDEELELIERKIRSSVRGKSPVEVMVAREGLTVEA